MIARSEDTERTGVALGLLSFIEGLGEQRFCLAFGYVDGQYRMVAEGKSGRIDGARGMASSPTHLECIADALAKFRDS